MVGVALGVASQDPMSRRYIQKAASPVSLPLPPRHMRFLNAYAQRGYKNATDAYQEVYPTCKRSSAKISASILLTKANVQEELARRVQAEQGWNHDAARARVLDIAKRAQETGAYDTELRAVIELNELAGLHVKQLKDVTPRPDVNRQQVLEELRVRALVPVN